VLHLEHGALPRGVCRVERLRDDSVQAGTLEPFEPVAGDRGVGRHPREVDRVGVGEVAQRSLEARAALAERHTEQALVAFGEEVETDQLSGGFDGQFANP
jgi:hypothetical protein